MQSLIIGRCAMAALAAAAMLAPVSPALAGQSEAPIVSTAKTMPWDGVRTMAVSYADLNLRSDSAVERLNTRVHHAAEFVCDIGPRIDTLPQRQDGRNCYNGAMDRASRDIAAVVALARSGNQYAARGGANAIRVSRR